MTGPALPPFEELDAALDRGSLDRLDIANTRRCATAGVGGIRTRRSGWRPTAHGLLLPRHRRPARLAPQRDQRPAKPPLAERGSYRLRCRVAGNLWGEMRILLLEDDPGLGQGVSEYLRMQGHDVTWAACIADAEDQLHQFHPELLLLDLSLPDGSGLDFLQAIRQQGDDRPALILTARDQVRDRIAGLNTGADDYLVKPFDLAELGARIASVTRRSLGPPRLTCHGGAIGLDLAANRATVAGQEVQLTGREWALLTLLARRPGQTVPRQRIEEVLRQLGGDFESNAVEVYVGRIRRKLGHDAIETLRGVGYRLRP